MAVLVGRSLGCDPSRDRYEAGTPDLRRPGCERSSIGRSTYGLATVAADNRPTDREVFLPATLAVPRDAFQGLVPNPGHQDALVVDPRPARRTPDCRGTVEAGVFKVLSKRHVGAAPRTGDPASTNEI